MVGWWFGLTALWCSVKDFKTMVVVGPCGTFYSLWFLRYTLSSITRDIYTWTTSISMVVLYSLISPLVFFGSFQSGLFLDFSYFESWERNLNFWIFSLKILKNINWVQVLDQKKNWRNSTEIIIKYLILKRIVLFEKTKGLLPSDGLEKSYSADRMEYQSWRPR